MIYMFKDKMIPRFASKVCKIQLETCLRKKKKIYLENDSHVCVFWSREHELEPVYERKRRQIAGPFTRNTPI